MSAYDLSSGNKGYPGLQRLMRKTTMPPIPPTPKPQTPTTDRPMTSPSVREQLRQIRARGQSSAVENDLLADAIDELRGRIDALTASIERLPEALVEIHALKSQVVELRGELSKLTGPPTASRTPRDPDAEEKRPNKDAAEVISAFTMLADLRQWFVSRANYDQACQIRDVQESIRAEYDSALEPPSPSVEEGEAAAAQDDWAKDAAELIFDDQPKQPRSWGGNWEYRHAPYATKAEADEARQRCVNRAADIIRAAHGRAEGAEQR